MESTEFVESRLVNYTEADEWRAEAENNRMHYYLTFSTSIGWDWIFQQVKKCSANLHSVSVEPYEIHPSGDGKFVVEVRELDRRPEIDTDQCGLGEYAQE